MENFIKNLLLASKLHAAGLLSDEQEAELINNAKEKFIAGTAQNPALVNSQAEMPENTLLDAFFEVAERKELKDFFEKNVPQKNIGWDNMLSQMIKNIEEQAISGYEKKKNFSDNLRHGNDSAKGKLSAQAQSAGFGDKEPDKIFTRAELANLSNDDFKKYEKIIFEQLKKGLIH